MNFYGETPFIYLNNSHRSSKCVFDHIDCNKENFIFRKEGEYKGYYLFHSLNSFYQWYQKIPIHKRNFHEVIVEGYQKFRMDIDEYTSNLDILITLISKLFTQWFKINPTIEIFDNETTYHLVISNMYFKDAYICKKICEEIEYYLLSEYEIQMNIDRSIYSTNHCFRIEGSTKSGETRYKKNRNHDDIIDFDAFSKGIIKYITNCTLADNSDLFPSLNTQYSNSLYKDSESFSMYGSHTMSHTLNDYKDKYDPSIFKIRKKSYNRNIDIVILDRKKPAYCTICTRIHDKENAYISKTNGKFYCFRNNNNSVI